MARLGVVGGGPAGAAAALDLARKGHEVVLVEAGDRLGGLVASLRVGGTPIERFYHHVFPQERTIQALLRDLGLGEKLEWLPSRVGVYRDGRVWPFTTPVDLLRFGPLPPPDRLRLGVSGLLLSRARDWTRLDRVPARRWLARASGTPATDVVWKPMLDAKFGSASDTVPAAWMWGRFDQRAGARQGAVEKLGYLRGGFRQLFDALETALLEEGVDLRLGVRVTEVDAAPEGVTITLDGSEALGLDGLLWTAGLPLLDHVAGAPDHLDTPTAADVPGLGVLSVVLELARPVTDVYWLNICDDDVPYGALVEHTNFVPPSDYGGRHVLYLARYFTHDEPVASADPEAEADRWVTDLQHRFPHLRDEDVLARHVSRAPYAAPLVQLGHLERVRPLRTELPRVWAASMAQVYPHDRGMNDGMELALQAGRGLAEEVTGGRPWSCPVCGLRRPAPLWDAPAEASEAECGVTAAAFRPSAEAYGATVGAVVRCRDCGHGSLADPVDADALADAYVDAADPVSLRERRGQVETADRALDLVEQHVGRGRMVDVGCWTGSFVEAADRRGWQASGIEPSNWAVEVARSRGLDVQPGLLAPAVLADGAHDLVVACDVLEHLLDPGGALDLLHAALRPGGVAYLTVPDAGSTLARALGERWWSVLPMHVQYFTRSSMAHLLRRHGFEPVVVRTHAKVFTARYYAERVRGYSAAAADGLVGALERIGVADRLVGPDLRDRMQVVARRR